MTPEKIIEIAHRYSDKAYPAPDDSSRVTYWEFLEKDLIAFARALIAEERERVKSRVKEAAENLWCIRNEVVEEVDGELKRMPYSLYIGPSLTTLEQFVEKLMEEE